LIVAPTFAAWGGLEALDDGADLDLDLLRHFPIGA
jgi:hypothetical protein